MFYQTPIVEIHLISNIFLDGNPNTSNTDEDDEDEHEFYDAQEGYTPTGAIIGSNTNLNSGNAPPNSVGVVTSTKEDSSFILKIPLQQRRNSEGSSGSDQEDKSESKQVNTV